MQRYRPVRAFVRLVLAETGCQHAYNTRSLAAAPSPLRAELANESSDLSVAYERRIQEMYRAAARPDPLAESTVVQRDISRTLPSAEEVSDRLNSHRGASCSSSVSSTDSNTGTDWREALAMLQAADKQNLQRNMLTDTFRCCLLLSAQLFPAGACQKLHCQGLNRLEQTTG